MPRTGTIMIERPFAELAELLSVRPADWAVSFLRIAAYAGEAAGARSINTLATPGSREITVELYDAERRAEGEELVVPVRWRTTGFRWIPPSYAGRIVVRRLTAQASEMLLEGSYALPADAEDETAAAAAAVATEAAVDTFLRSFRVAVEEQAKQPV